MILAKTVQNKNKQANKTLDQLTHIKCLNQHSIYPLKLCTWSNGKKNFSVGFTPCPTRNCSSSAMLRPQGGTSQPWFS